MAHYNLFSDHWNQLYDKSASLRCGGKLFHSPGPAVTKALHWRCRGSRSKPSVILYFNMTSTAGIAYHPSSSFDEEIWKFKVEVKWQQ